MDIQVEPGLRTTPQPLPERARTSQRLKYEAEIKVFKARYGDLETVRKNLGFSRRRMCQLLLVDPSAWTRWHSSQGQPPPHIYRALEWFLALEGKTELHPKLADIYLKGSPVKPTDGRLPQEIEQLRTQIARLRLYLWLTPVASAAATAALILIFR